MGPAALLVCPHVLEKRLESGVLPTPTPASEREKAHITIRIRYAH